jgi:pimeloyl-ACP methyl ester carboxylesterase
MPTINGQSTLTGLYYEVHGESSKPALLLLHGYTVRGDMFYPMLDLLRPHFRIVLPDLRGFARSSNMQGPLDQARFSEDIALLLELLAIPHTHVFGYRMGGTVAQQFALDYPQMVDRLVLGCTWAYKNQTVGEMAQQVLAPGLVGLLGSQLLARGVNRRWASLIGLVPEDELIEWYKEVLASNRTEALTEALESIFKFDSRSRLRQLHTPTLVIGASKDTVVPPYHARMLAKGIPNAELEMFPGEGHALIYSQPLALARQVLAFLGIPQLAAEEVA